MASFERYRGISNELRAYSYKLLSDCYYPPDEELIKKLSNLDTSAEKIFLELANSVSEIDGLELLKVDFSRLFVGPFKLLAPPYGSVYLEDNRMVMGDSTIDVRNRYRNEGLCLGIKEAPDHIAIELEFMYFLTFKEVEAVLNADFGSAAIYIKKQISFLEDHLCVWLQAFANTVERNAQSFFYKSLARLTKSFVRNDFRLLKSRCPNILSQRGF